MGDEAVRGHASHDSWNSACDEYRTHAGAAHITVLVSALRVAWCCRAWDDVAVRVVLRRGSQGGLQTPFCDTLLMDKCLIT